MKLFIQHQTIYLYGFEASYSLQNLRLTPRKYSNQKTISWDIDVPGELSKYVDTFGNINHLLTLNEPHKKIVITSKGEIETNTKQRKNNDHLPLNIFLKNTTLTVPGPNIKRFIKKFKLNGIGFIEQLASAIIQEVSYEQGTTESSTNAEKSFSLKKGVCQDHAHIMLACCRALGYPARYISGYMLTEGTNETQTHAWVEVFCDNHWINYDVSNNCFVDEKYVTLAYGLDYKTAAPIIGIRHGGGIEGMSSQVSVVGKEHKLSINSKDLEKKALMIQTQQQ